MALPSPAFVSEQKPREDKPNQQTVKTIQNANKNFHQNRQKSFDCRVCTIKFDTQNELFQHRKNHETCPFDGCKFNALENVVTAHYQRAHVGNASLKVQDLSTPEEIEKWREERRKRYPTVANVILKQQINDEKNQRGERIQKSDRRFGDFKQKKFIESSGRDHQHNHSNKRHIRQNHHMKNFNKNNRFNRNRHDQQDNTRKISAPVETKASGADVETTRKTPAFGGMAIAETPVVDKPTNSLSLLGQYSSDESDGEIEDEPENQPIVVKIDPELESEPEEVPIERIDEGKSVQPAPIVRPDRKHPPRDFNKGKRKINPNCPLLDYAKLRKTSANPFLEKLLQDDIQHERNVILQCVNFIVKNDFLGIEKSTQNSDDNKSN